MTNADFLSKEADLLLGHLPTGLYFLKAIGKSGVVNLSPFFKK
jgi:hypothetical protein